MPTNGFSIKPLKVKFLAGEQTASEKKSCQDYTIAMSTCAKSTLWMDACMLFASMPGAQAGARLAGGKPCTHQLLEVSTCDKVPKRSVP